MASQAARDNREEGVCRVVGRGGESVCARVFVSMSTPLEVLYIEGNFSRENDKTWCDK